MKRSGTWTWLECFQGTVGTLGILWTANFECSRKPSIFYNPRCSFPHPPAKFQGWIWYRHCWRAVYGRNISNFFQRIRSCSETRKPINLINPNKVCHNFIRKSSTYCGILNIAELIRSKMLNCLRIYSNAIISIQLIGLSNSAAYAIFVLHWFSLWIYIASSQLMRKKLTNIIWLKAKYSHEKFYQEISNPIMRMLILSSWI